MGWSGNYASGSFAADNTGWTTSSAYGANGAARFGTGKALGSAETPSISCGSATTATLTFKAGAWNGNSESTTLKLSYTNCSGDASVSINKGEWKDCSVTLSNITGNIKIKFEGNATSNSRFFLDDVKVTYTATTSKTLSSIEISTPPTTTKYLDGDTFDKTGAVVTAHYDDNSTADVSGSVTWNKAALGTSDTQVTASYTEGGVTETANQSINVYAVTMQARDEDGNEIATGGPGAPSRDGHNISPAADAGNYVFKEWSIVNAALGSNKADKNNTITDPEGAVTVTAVYYKPILVSWYKNGSPYETTYTGYNMKPVFPEEPSSCDATSNAFYGWATSTWDDTVDDLEGKDVYTSADDMPAVTATGTVYNAVFAKADAGAVSWEKASSIKAGDVIVIVNENASKELTAVSTSTSGTGTATAYSTTPNGSYPLTVETGNGGTGFSFKNGNNYLCYNSSSTSSNNYLWTITEKTNYSSWSVSISSGDATITNVGNTSRKLQFNSSANPQRFACYTSSQSSVQIYKQVSSITYSKFRTNCCDPLGQINGSVSWSSPTTAVISWPKNANVTAWAMTCKQGNTNMGSIGALDATGANNQITISNLTAGQSYDITLSATTTTGNYCTGLCDFSISSITAPLISVSSLSGDEMTYAEGNGPSNDNTFTVSGVGLTGETLNVTAPDNFQVSTDNGESWSTAQSPTKTIAISNKTVNATVKVRLAAELNYSDDPYAGDVTVSGGSAADQTIAVSATVTVSCHTPNVSDPSGATYYLNEETPTDLSVTATKGAEGDPDLTYQWYSNTANSKTTPAPTPIDGATSSSYTPLTTAAGTKYYFCVVKSDACEASSGIAAVAVRTPSIIVSTTSIAFGDKKKGGSYTETFTVNGVDLANGAGLSLNVPDGMFTIDKTTLPATSNAVGVTTITVTYAPTTAAAHNATLTITSTGATSKTITLSGTGREERTITFNDNGSTTTEKWLDGSQHATPSILACKSKYGVLGWTTTAPTSNAWSTQPSYTTAGNNITVNGDATYYAVYTEEGETPTNNYRKITSASELISGRKYVITNTSDNYALNCSNLYYNQTTTPYTYYFITSSVSPSSNIITTTSDAIIFTIEGNNIEGYSIYSEEDGGTGIGYYDRSEAGGYVLFWFYSAPQNWLINVSDGSVTINPKEFTSRYLHYEYYNSGNSFLVNTTATANHLYRQVYNTTYLANPDCRTLESIAVKTAPTSTYCESDWLDMSDLVITATYSDESTKDFAYASNIGDFSFTPTASTDLTTLHTSVTINYLGKETSQAITVNALHTIELTDDGALEHGTIDADWTTACAGETVTLTASNIATHYSFGSWSVYKKNDQSTTVSVNQNGEFTMPDYDVVVDATFNEDPKHTITFMNNNVVLSEETMTVYDGETYGTLPTLTAEDACSDESTTFMGWTTATITTAQADAPEMVSAETVMGNANVILEAVWAKKTENKTAATVVNNYGPESSLTKVNRSGTGSYDSESPKLIKFDGTGDYIQFELDFAPTQLSFYYKMVGGASTSTMDIQECSTADGTYTSVQSFSISGDQNSTGTKTTSNTFSEKYIRMYFTKGSNVGVTNITIQGYTGTVTYSEYLTRCCVEPASALSITNADKVVKNNNLSLTTTGGNGGTVTWSVVNSGSTVASVSGSTLSAGSVEGTITVKAHQDLYDGKCAQDAEMVVEITSGVVAVTGVSVSPTSKSIVIGETFTITPTISPNNATDNTVSWTSSADAKATVTNAGLVEGKAVGEATITCTTTDGSFEAECAVNVYGVTVQVTDEDGIVLSGEGKPSISLDVTAVTTATAGNYVFKEWQVENATLADETKISATITSPTGAVTVTAVYYKPVSVTWLVDGENYAEGEPTTVVAHGTQWKDLTLPTAPAHDAIGDCAEKFVGWSNSMTEEWEGKGHTAPETLLKSFDGITTAIETPITFRAVFATIASQTGEAVNTIMLKEQFTGYSNGNQPSAPGSNATKFASGISYSYSHTTDNPTRVMVDNNGPNGNNNANMMVKSGQYFEIQGIPNGGASVLTVSYKQNAKSLNVSVSGTGYSGGLSANTGTSPSFDVIVGSATTFTLRFAAAGSENVRIDDIEVKVKERSYTYSNYMTKCCTKHAITLSGVEAGEKEFSADVEQICADEIVTLSATSNGHYNFASWNVHKTGDENTTLTVTNNQFTMPAYPVTVKANWTPKDYKVTIVDGDHGSATIKETTTYSQDGDGNWVVPYGSTVTLQATADDGYYFSEWWLNPGNSSVDATKAELAITMPEDFEAMPVFEEIQNPELRWTTSAKYSLEVKTGNNTITNGAQIVSGTPITVTYSSNTQYEVISWDLLLETTPGNYDEAFSSFNVSGDVVTFNMPNKNLSIEANTEKYYTLDLSVTNGSYCSIQVDGVAQEIASSYRVHEDEIISLTVTADESYKFMGWTKTGVLADEWDENGTSVDLQVDKSNITISASFVAKERYNVTLMALGQVQETMVDQLEGTSVWSLIDSKEAPALLGYGFVGWSASENGTPLTSGTAGLLNEHKTLYAVYKSLEYSYQLVESDLGANNWAGDYLIAYSSTVFADGRVAGTTGMGNQNQKVNPGTNLSGKVVDASWGDQYNVILEEIINNNQVIGYLLKTKDGQYNYQTNNSSGLASTENRNTAAQYPLSVTYNSSSNIGIANASGAVFHYNTGGYFRFYKDGGQSPVYLYKKVGTPIGSAISVPTLTVADEETIKTSEAFPDGHAGNIVVENGGKLNVDEALVVNNVTIQSKAGESGQLTGAGNVTVNGNIYMDVKFYTSANDATEATLNATEANQWYMISAPFDVNLADGFINPVSGATMTFGQVDGENIFDLFEYDGLKRANTGVTGWRRVQGHMPAGKACLIGFNPGQPTTIRLKAASNTISDATSIDLESFGDAVNDADNANWNGVANPTMHYITLDDANLKVQVYENDEENRGYQAYSANGNSFVVGTAFFIHRSEDVDLSSTINSTLRAPKREAATVDDYEYCVRITRDGANTFANQMYVRASEEATAQYEYGHDVETLNGATAKHALIWTENYGKRLAVEEAPLVNNSASYALGIYAPNAGQYTISVPTERADADLYLTYEGLIIWNLSMGEYEIDLNKGTTNGYGLLLQAKAPQVVTGVDEVDAETGVQKVIIDEHVFILRGGQMYDVTGKMVK